MTVTDNANQYGQETAAVVRSNFNMDGLLKCNVQHVQWDDVVGPELRNDWERWEHKLKGVEVYTYQVVSSLTCLERS